MTYLPIDDAVGGQHIYCVKDDTIPSSIIIGFICICAGLKQLYIHFNAF